MGVKTFFQKLFGIDPSKYSRTGTNAHLLNGSPTEFSSYSGQFWDNPLVRSIVHKIATYGSMVSFEHVQGSGEDFVKRSNSHINKLLTKKPNSLLMTPSELQYKIWVDLLLKNNSYLWLKRDSTGKVTEIYPIVANNVELKEVDGFLFYKFSFSSGEIVIESFEDIIHFRRYYYNNDMFGSDNEPLRNPLGLVDTLNISLDASLKNGAQIKGILKHQNTIDPEDLKKHEQLFRESYLSAKNSGGIGMLDAKFDFIPISYSGKIIDGEQMKEIRDYVYRYFGVNDKILMSSYTSEEWQAYYEGVMMPILNSMEQAYNIHMFTDKELGYGNRVMSSTNMMTFLNPAQKISMVKLALDGSLYMRNEIRQWFGDAPIPGGDTFQYSKNFTETTAPNTITQKQGGNDGQQSNTPTEQEPQTAETDSSAQLS